jgi:DNA-binding transcriptional ArsR family regulator
MAEDADLVFRALADPTRRALLDRLFERDGQTLTELESEVDMTRFGVMKHLKVLEDANLVVTRRSGREKLHYLNPVPIRRSTTGGSSTEPWRLVDLKRQLRKRMTTTTKADVHQGVPGIHRRRRRRPGAITEPAWTQKYGYQGRSSTTSGRAARSATCGQGDAGRRCRRSSTARCSRSTRRASWFDPALPLERRDQAEGPTTLTYEIGDLGTGLQADADPRAGERAHHDRADRRRDRGAGGGWAYVLSDIKTLLETGTCLTVGAYGSAT